MRIIAFAILCILLLSGIPVAAAPTFALGAIRQATPANPQEYVVEVDVAADGYSTFSATIVTEPNTMHSIINWQTVEREQGVDVIITMNEPVTIPTRIMLIAQYQGRERAGRYWLKPIMTAPLEAKEIKNTKEKATVTAMAEIPVKVAEPVKIQEPEKKEPVCPYLVVRKGSLMENVERLTAQCGHRLGSWYPGNSEDLVDWIVKRDKHTKNSEGVNGLLAMLEKEYNLTGVMRTDGKDKYIDFYESGGH